MASLTVVYWRDIPAQVIARAGRKTARRTLAERFEKAIDQAAMHARLQDSDAYLAHWRRGDAAECGDDLEAEVASAVAALEAEFAPDVLAGYVRAGGLTPQAGSRGS